MRVRRTFCNVAMLGQMLRRTLSKHQVSDSPVMSSLPFSCFEAMSHSWWTSIVLFPGVQLNLSRSHSYDFSRQRKDHIHGRLCYFPQCGFEQFLFRLFPNGGVVLNFTQRWSTSLKSIAAVQTHLMMPMIQWYYHFMKNLWIHRV